MYPTNTAAPLRQCKRSAARALPDPHILPAALIEAARDALDALRGGVERVGDGDLHGVRALARSNTHILQRRELLLEPAHALGRLAQLVAERKRRHDDQPHVADRAEARLQLLDALIAILGEAHQMIFLALLAGQAVLPAMDGDADMAHCRASITERMFSIAVSRRCAISRLVASRWRARAVSASRSEASLERSVPRACTCAASAFSPRSVSRRCSNAPSRASRAADSRFVAASIALASVMASPRANGRRDRTRAPPNPVERQGFANETYVAFHAAVNARRSCGQNNRSEERRVGKECRSRWSPYH